MIVGETSKQPVVVADQPAWSRRQVLAAGAVLAGAAWAAACSDTKAVVEQTFVPITAGVLTVATTLPAPGFWNGDQPEAVAGGFEAKLAEQLAARLKLDLRVVNVPFANIVGGDFGGADLALAQISITSSRSKAVDFSVGYYSTSAGILAPAGTKINDLREARSRTWCVVGGTTEMKLLADVVKPSAPVSVVDTEVAAAAAIIAGTAETALVDLPVALIIAHDDPRLTVVARIETNEQYAAALPQSSPHRRTNKLAVDAAMRAFSTDGTLDRLTSTWLKPAFGVDPAKIPVVVTK